MIHTINDNINIDINKGDKIKTILGILPSEFDDQYIEVSSVDSSYVYIQSIDQESAISTIIITEVKK